MIPVFRPSYGPEEHEALREPLASGWVGLGPKTQEFEQRFAEYVGVPHAVGTNSATAALHLAVKLLGVEGREVVTTSLTFVSTNHVILSCGGIPVFADVDPETLCLDPERVAERITPRTAAIMVVDYGGHPAELDELLSLAAEHGLAVVEDAAHACGASYKGARVGSIADLTCFSFHAVKNLACGEGGMVTLADEASARRLRSLRWLGIDRSTWERTGAGGEGASRYSWQYGVEEVGLKAHLSDIPSAIGLVQLAKLEANNERRRRIAHTYDEAFSGLGWVQTPVVRPYVVTAQHNYVIRVPASRRNALIDHLAGRGVAASVHYFPNHLYPVYRPYTASLPVTEAEWQRLVTLPLFPDLTESEIAQVIDAVRSFR
jgi:perosamine synthetase